MYIQSNTVSFNGWEPNQMLKESGKINNGDVLEALADVSNVDFIHTNMIETKYLPSKHLYTNVVRKSVGDQFVYGVDCITLPKDASSEKVSENIFESAQRAVGKFYAKMATLNLSNAPREVNEPVLLTVSKKPNVFKRCAQFLLSNLKK